MTSPLVLRPIDDEGQLGRALGSVRVTGNEMTVTGSPLAGEILRGVATRRGVSLARAAELIADEPYGNQKIVLQSERAQINSRTKHGPRAHLPGEHDQGDHAGGKVGAAVKKLMSALEALGGEIGGKYYDDRDGMESGRYLDVSFGNGDERDYASIETGHADDDDRVAQITLHRDELREFASAMATTMLAREDPLDGDDPRSVLLSSLMLSGENGGYHPGDPRSDEPHTETNRNLDWNFRDGEWMFEAYSDDTDATAFSLNDEEFRALHASIVMTLLEDERQRNE